MHFTGWPRDTSDVERGSGVSELYASSFMAYNVTYNIHVQPYVPDVTTVHGSLDSAYAFKNYLGTVTKSVASSHDSVTSLIKGMKWRKANISLRTLQQPKVKIQMSQLNNIRRFSKNGPLWFFGITLPKQASGA